MNTKQLIVVMAEDIVSYFQTIFLMEQSKGNLNCRMRFYFDAERYKSGRIHNPTWRDIQKSAFGGICWLDETSPIHTYINKPDTEDTPFDSKVTRFLVKNCADLCAEVARLMSEEGFEHFTVANYGGEYVEICAFD